jgi:uncharacterized membrane protein
MHAHLLNVAVHIGAGLLAMALGFYLLVSPKADPRHRRLGRIFAALTLAVCASAAVGNVAFRFQPLFAVLTVLVTYQLLSGWRVVYTRARGPGALDALLLLGGAACAGWLVPHLFDPAAGRGAGNAVVVSSLGGLAGLLVYDAARWLFPRRWHATLWLYEHIFKLVASLFAMLSAAIGNTVRAGQPWSQLAPSVAGMIVIAWFWQREHRARRRKSINDPDKNPQNHNPYG